jgi:ribosomal protein S18 acetylase RimI-like enzyme
MTVRTGIWIRQAEPRDIPVLKEIVDLSFPRFFRFFASHSIDSEDGELLVSECNGEVVGFAKLRKFHLADEKYGCIFWLAVHPNHRRKGVASALVNFATEELEREGQRGVFASVKRTNKASLATFRKEGFEQAGLVELWRLFSWRIFQLYRDIWSAPTEIVLIHGRFLQTQKVS